MSEDAETGRSGIASRLILGILAAAGLGLLLAAGGPRQLLTASATELAALQDVVARMKALAVLLYIAGYAGVTMLIFVPRWIFAVIGGAFFGLWLGALYAVLGATLGDIAVFSLARLGIGNLARRAAPLLEKVEAMFHANEFSLVLVLRLVPVMPAAIVNIASGMLKLRLPVFALATIIGIVPSTLIYASFGATLGGLVKGDTLPTANLLLEPRVLLPLLGLAALALVPIGYGWLRGRSA
jgi:uncharacterized membrane protein YdjX (TVP38/TMEM64 family)